MGNGSDQNIQFPRHCLKWVQTTASVVLSADKQRCLCLLTTGDLPQFLSLPVALSIPVDEGNETAREQEERVKM